MNNKVFYSISIFLLIASSCMKEIDLEHLRPDPRLVLNSVAIVGEPVNASLSRTWFYTDDQPNVTIKNARIKLYVNDTFKEDMTFVEEIPPSGSEDPSYNGNQYNNLGYYLASYKPVTGDCIRITAESEGYQPIEADITMPETVPVTSLSVVAKQINNNGWNHTKNEIKVTFTDDPGKKNYYLIRFEAGEPVGVYDPETGEYIYTGEYRWVYYDLDYSDDPLFTGNISALDEVMGYDWISGYYGRVFSDEQINGKEYTINLTSFSSYYTRLEDEVPPVYCRVLLYSIPEPYYNYLKSVIELQDDLLSNDLAKIGLSEPIRIYSNIQGGTGILGAGNPSSLTTEIPREVIENW